MLYYYMLSVQFERIALFIFYFFYVGLYEALCLVSVVPAVESARPLSGEAAW